MQSRIPANSFFLSVRTVTTVLADCCAVRIALKHLGVGGYGAFVAIGTIVAMSRMFNGALSTTAQRFVGAELGKGSEGELQSVFSVLLSLTIAFAFCVVLLLETVGVWFLNTRLFLPSDAVGAAGIVYHSAVLAAVIGIVQVPFSSLVVAGERMSFFATISLVEAAVSVAAAVASRWGLGVYAVSFAVGSLLVFALFWLHCARHFGTLRLRPALSSGCFFGQGRFFAWGLLSGVGNAMKYQGVSLLLNRQCGPALNAAWSVAIRSRNFFLPLCQNILQATAPAVYKAWGCGNAERFRLLTGRSLLVSFVCVLIPSTLAFAFAPELVGVWLGNEVPPLTVPFVRCSLVGLAADALSQPLTTAINATGRVALYQGVVSGLSVLACFAAWFLLSAGFPAWSAMAAVAAVNVLSCLYRLGHVRLLMNVRPCLSLARRSP